MYTTFIIGNGFDLCQHMETRYCQFYENHYIKLPTEGIDPALIDFRKEITNFINKEKRNKDNAHTKNEIDWSDLESALGKYASKLSIDSDYIYIALDINKELQLYIENQDKKFSISEKDYVKIYNDFCKPDVTSYLNYEESEAMRQYKKNLGPESIDIINFNYTNTIEKILDAYRTTPNIKNIVGNVTSINQVLHIHSRIGDNSSILVGVNDPSQICNEKFRTNLNVLDILVKPETNKMFGNGRIAQAKRMINQAHVIVLFGVSLGETDKMWWELIGKNLQSKDVRLIWFVYESPGIENRLLIGGKKRELIKHFCDVASIPEENRDKISSKIYIGYNTNIFKAKSSK